VLEANYAVLGLPRNTPIKTICMDARNVVDNLAPGRTFDLVFGDAFSDLSVPYHLTTVEFYRKIAKHLKPGGAILQNIIDNYESALMVGSTYVTLKKIFKHVYVFSTSRFGVTPRRETFVVASSNQPIKVSDWLPGHDTPFAGSVLTPESIHSIVERCGHRVLTDDDCPVENLLQPVVRARH